MIMNVEEFSIMTQTLLKFYRFTPENVVTEKRLPFVIYVT